MNSQQFLQEIPHFFGEYIDGAEPDWILPPAEDLDIHAGAWSFRMSAAPKGLVAIKVLGNENHEVRITVGLAIDVPYSPTLAEYVNYLNNKMLIFGRVFIAGDIPFIGENGNGPCVVVMQEIVFATSLSFEFPPSMQNLLNLTARLAAQADRFSPELVEQFGGRPLADPDAPVLTLY